MYGIKYLQDSAQRAKYLAEIVLLYGRGQRGNI